MIAPSPAVRRITGALLLALVFAAAATPASAIPMYRGVRAAADGTIDWTSASFGVSGQPVPTLSFFDTIVPADLPPPPFPIPACWLELQVDAVAGTMAVTIPANRDHNTIPQPAWPAQPSPWTIVNDNVPPHHWSIAKGALAYNPGTSNAEAGRIVSDVMIATNAAGNVVIHDGAVANCH